MAKKTKKQNNTKKTPKQRAALAAKVVALKKQGLSFRAIEIKLAKSLGRNFTKDKPGNGFVAFRLFRAATAA